MIDQPGRAFGQRLHGRVLGVEDAQRVGVQAAACVLVELVGMLLEVGDQRRTVLAPLFRLAQAVELQPPVRQAQLAPQRHGQQDQLGIHLRPGKAQRLGADLVELPVAAALRTLAAEHGAHVEQALAAVVQQVVLGHGAHQAGRTLGAQRQVVGVAVLVLPVLEGVHLLLDNVGHLAQAAGEQLGVLHDRRAGVAVGEPSHHAAHRLLQPLPARRDRRQDVVHALDGGDLR